MAVMGSGIGDGSSRARKALEAALCSNPLLDDFKLNPAAYLWVKIVGNFAPRDVQAVTEVLQSYVSDESCIKIEYQEEALAENVLQVSLIMAHREDAREWMMESGKVFQRGG